jgi:SAM-dependent methyltransferase
MGQDHQKIYHRAWSQLGPPLRPPADVIVAVREQITDLRGRALLLGVTPELADVAPHLVAVDRNFSMVANVWPGNTSSRYAIVGDWRCLSFEQDTFSICIGDGSLSFLRFPDEIVTLLVELNRVLKTGGRMVFRLYLAPDMAETISTLKDEALSGKINNFHAFKLRLAMALAARQSVPQIRVGDILDAFNSLFENRQELVQAVRWSREQIDTIDFYKDSAVLYFFPKKDQILSLVSKVCHDAQLVPSGNYEMSELCPLLVAPKY